MREIIVSANEAGQRMDKLLAKYLSEAPKSFIYKMLRKKNIVLNGKKADGSEKLKCEDSVKLFLSEETIEKFTKRVEAPKNTDAKVTLDILYEDSNILLINKPVGMLSQKAKPEDVSLVEHLITYLLGNGTITQEELALFRPSVCNRLDRNTSGIVVAGKSLVGLQVMGQLFKDRSLKKFYRCLVLGEVKKDSYIKGYLTKDEKTNKVTVTSKPSGEASPIETSYQVIASNGRYTLLEVHLITGRTHQIRAHLASIGHPIAGDYKYGSRTANECLKSEYKLTHQLLHAYRLEMPAITGELENLSNKIFTAPLPKRFTNILRCEKIAKE